jgi:hypothetical protein
MGREWRIEDSMAQKEPERAPLTEPVVRDCLFCTGFEIETLSYGVVRFVGWVDVPALGYDQPERRVIARLVMPSKLARDLVKRLQRALHSGEH